MARLDKDNNFTGANNYAVAPTISSSDGTRVSVRTSPVAAYTRDVDALIANASYAIGTRNNELLVSNLPEKSVGLLTVYVASTGNSIYQQFQSKTGHFYWRASFTSGKSWDSWYVTAATVVEAVV